MLVFEAPVEQVDSPQGGDALTPQDPVNETPPAPAGLFNLGGYDIGAGQLGIGAIIIICLALVAFYFTRKSSEEQASE